MNQNAQPERGPTAAPSAADREAVMSALGDAYAADQLELEELERRMARVYRATSHDALAEVLTGLGSQPAALTRAPIAPGSSPARSLATQRAQTDQSIRAYDFGLATIARPEIVPERAVLMGVMGAAERKGAWVVPRQLKVFAAMGGVDLDFREAQFGSGVTEVEIFALFGGVDIKVPTGVRVESTGVGIMGGFSVSGADADPGPDAPVLRINGVAIMGGVEAKMKKIKRPK